jgi:hypothetical protein
VIETLTFAVMAATMAATPCEGLKAVSLPNTPITRQNSFRRASSNPFRLRLRDRERRQLQHPLVQVRRRRLQSLLLNIVASWRF